METVSILMPTFNNPSYLTSCIRSIVNTRAHEDLFKIYVIDNGTNPCKRIIPHSYLPYLEIIETGKNLGWEGGLKEGLKHVPEEVKFVMFANDDIFVPSASRYWLYDMLQWFKYPSVAAVGPTSNVVMGAQNIFGEYMVKEYSVEYLIGFCMLLRKDRLMEAGGVDETLPGGDDLDLSIRLKDKGYNLLVDRNVFVWHHGFKTGERLYGGSTNAGGWNSYEQFQKTNTALIQKHGFARWQRIMMNQLCEEHVPDSFWEKGEDIVIRRLIQTKHKRIFDLGCGANKTTSRAIGFDLFPKGTRIPSLENNSISQADIVADVSKPLPEKDADMIISRHILEHMIDPLDAIANWRNALKVGGELVIAVPDETISQTIPINKEHKHAFTPDSLKRIMVLLGFTDIQDYKTNNFVSFVMKGTKS